METNAFSHTLGSLRSGCQIAQVVSEYRFPGLQTAVFSLCPLMTERELASFLASSCKGTNSIHEGSTLTT